MLGECGDLEGDNSLQVNSGKTERLWMHRSGTLASVLDGAALLQKDLICNLEVLLDS